MFSGIFGDKKKRAARQLNLDATAIIEQAEQIYALPRLRIMAETVTDFIERAHVQYGTLEIDLKRAHFDYRGLHKEARRKNDQVGLTAITLVIIYIRAEINGPLANPARAAIEAFTAKWLHEDTAVGERPE